MKIVVGDIYREVHDWRIIAVQERSNTSTLSKSKPLTGRFIPQRFEDIFAKWDHDGKGGLSFWDLW